ncbi:MAG: prohibitin family protein [Deltaproteobacteria bacterium]|nr:prohibitin family protein [Deltaproteobacteria bacterium]
MSQIGKGVKFIGGFFVVMILLNILSPFVIIGPGERGVVLRFGAVSDKIFNEGFHFVTPLMEKVVRINTQPREIKLEHAQAVSKDLQDVITNLTLNYTVVQLEVNQYVQQPGVNRESVILDPAMQESLKSVTAQFTAAELITEREKVSSLIQAKLQDVLKKNHLEYRQLAITNFQFSKAFSDAIERKQVAQQDALTAENELKKAQILAEQRIAQAKAEAEAIRIQTEALQQNQNLVKLEAVKRWDGKLPQYMMGNSVPFVDISHGDSK